MGRPETAEYPPNRELITAWIAVVNIYFRFGAFIL